MGELPGVSPQEMRFSNRLLDRFRPRRDVGASPQTEQQPPSHRVVLNRTGNLSQVTELNQGAAD